MSTIVKIDLDDKGAEKSLDALSRKFASTGAAADKLGGSISGVQGRSENVVGTFQRLALGGAAWQALTTVVSKFNEEMKKGAAEGVEPYEISLDRLFTRIAEGQGVFAKLSGLLGKGLGESIFDAEEKEKRLDKAIAARQKRQETVDKIISDNQQRYASTELAMRQRAMAQDEQDAAKKLESLDQIAAAEQRVLDTMKRQRQEADIDATKDAFDAKSIEESNRRKDQAKQEGEIKLQALFARRAELESKYEEQLKTEVERIRETIQAMKDAGDADFSRIRELEAREEQLNKKRKDQAGVIREQEQIDHRKRLERIAEQAAAERQFFEDHKQLWQEQQNRENDRRQKRVDALAGVLRPQGLGTPLGGDGAQMRMGGPAANPVQQFIDALNPREIRQRILNDKLKELAEQREAAVGGLQGRELAREQDRFRRRERLLRNDLNKGIVGGRGGIEQADVAKAQNDELQARLGLVAQQQKWGGDMLNAFRQAGQDQIEQANMLAQQMGLIKKLQAQMEAAMQLLRKRR